MKQPSRALIFSIAAHLALFALAYAGYRWHKTGQDFFLQAPLGSVFVQEASVGKRKPPEAEPSPSAPTNGEAEAGPTGDEREDGEESPEQAGLPDGEATPLGHIEPTYPPAARRMGEEGKVVLLLGIAEDGTVTSAVIEQSSSHARLDEAARSALLDARFQPAVQEGAPLPSMKRFTVEFKLEKPRRL